MAYTDYFDQIRKLYIAYYQRPADPQGLVYWADRLDRAGGNLDGIIEVFANSPESRTLYGEINSETISNVVTDMYQALFSRAPDEAGKKFYVDAFTAGEFPDGRPATAGTIALDILNGAQNEDLDAIENKVETATQFTQMLDPDLDGLDLQATYAGDDDAQAGRDFLAQVTHDPETLPSESAVEEYIQTKIANPGDSILIGETFTLTTATDTYPGTELNDIIEGVSSALSSERTLNPDDRIDGGAGSDTLKVDLQSSFTGFTDGYVKNVETVELTNSGTISRSFSAKDVTGVERYVLNGDVSLTNLAATDAAITLNGQQNDVTIGFDDEAIVGPTDALNVKLNGVGKAEDTATTAIEFNRVGLTVAGIETLNLGVTGANGVNVDAAAAKTVVATGEGSLDASFKDNDNLKTIDASGVTGKVAVDLDGLTEATTVKTGAGNDTIIAAEDELAVNAELDGGAGSDLLELSGTGTVQYTMGNIETVALGEGDLTFSAKNATGIETIEATKDFGADAGDEDNGDEDNGDEADFVDLGNTDLIFALGKDSGGEITADNAGAATVNVSGESDTELTLTKATGVILNLAKDSSYTGDIDALKAGSLKATIDGQLGISTEDDAAEIYMPEATGAVFNATSTNASLVDLHAAKLVDLDITTEGDFTINHEQEDDSSNLGKLETLIVDTAGDFAIDEDLNLSAIHSVKLSGTGTATLGTLGAYDLEYGITVNAGGLSNNGATDALTIDTIEVGEGQSIELNVADVAGTVRLIHHAGVARQGGVQTGSITVDADGTQGAVLLGTLDAKTVTVHATGALGEVHIGGVDTNANTGSGGINAETVNFTGSELKPNEVYVTASDSATLTGGIDDDTFMLVAVNGVGTTSEFTITGGLGDDKFLIDYQETLLGKSIVTITDFEEGDSTNIAAETLGVFTDESIALGALIEAGFAPTTADPKVLTFLDLYGSDPTYDSSVFTYGGNTYAVVGPPNAVIQDNATFDNGEIVIQLLGVHDADAINGAFVGAPV